MTTHADGTVDVVILAGGQGTRLRSVVADVPKPLAPVNGRPFLDYQFALLERAPGIGRVVLALGHLAERVVAHYAAQKPALDIAYSIETEPLGTGGALRLALAHTTSAQVFVLNGDSIFRWDLTALRAAHRRLAPRATMSLLQVENVGRYGAVAVAADRVVSFAEKTDRSDAGTINAGAYLMERAAIEAIPGGVAVSLERETLPALAASGALAAVGFDSPFIDIGLPETYRLAPAFIARFLPADSPDRG